MRPLFRASRTGANFRSLGVGCSRTVTFASALIDRSHVFRGQRVIFAHNLLATLRKRKVDELARTLEIETGLRYRATSDGQSMSGIYRRSFTLASGRFAMLDDETGFALVPWRPVIEQRIGQTLSAVVRGDFVSWLLGKNRALSRGGPRFASADLVCTTAAASNVH